MNFTCNLQSATGNGGKAAAFTLVEVIIAMGVLTISLVGILALFPVAFNTARESTYETRVAFIAETILADVKSTATSESDNNPTPTILRRSRILDDGMNELALLDLDQTAPSEAWFSIDIDGQLSGSISENEFESGVNDAGFVAKISAIYDTPEHPGLTEIRIVVEAPGIAPQANRRSYPFVTLMSLP
jgi:type II secretory pathway pseudopilin PulG